MKGRLREGNKRDGVRREGWEDSQEREGRDAEGGNMHEGEIAVRESNKRGRKVKVMFMVGKKKYGREALKMGRERGKRNRRVRGGREGGGKERFGYLLK